MYIPTLFCFDFNGIDLACVLDIRPFTSLDSSTESALQGTGEIIEISHESLLLVEELLGEGIKKLGREESGESKGILHLGFGNGK